MDPARKLKLRGFGFMFLSSSLMGGIGAFARYIEAPGEFISFCRNAAGFIGMTLIFMIGRRFVHVRNTRITPGIVFSGVFLGLLSALYVISTQMTTLANASFLIYTGPVYSTVLASIFLKEPFKKSMFGSLGAVILGMLIIIGIITYSSGDGLGMTLSLDPQYMTGNLIALGSGVAYGLYLFVSRYRTDVDSNTRSWFNFTFATITIGIILIFSRPDLSEMTTRGWIVLAVAATITGFGAFYFMTLATKILFAGELATIAYQETIMASVLGWILFSEAMTLWQGLGGLLIIAGGVSQILISTRKSPDVVEAFTQGGAAGGRRGRRKKGVPVAAHAAKENVGAEL